MLLSISSETASKVRQMGDRSHRPYQYQLRYLVELGAEIEERVHEHWKLRIEEEIKKQLESNRKRNAGNSRKVLLRSVNEEHERRRA